MEDPLKRYPRKPRTCPACGSARVAKVFYGLPALSEKLRREIDEGRIVLGGCCITDDDPQWQCADCGEQMYGGGDGEERA